MFFKALGLSETMKWSGRQDSNLRPSGPKPDALPGCATPRLALSLGKGVAGRKPPIKFVQSTYPNGLQGDLCRVDIVAIGEFLQMCSVCDEAVADCARLAIETFRIARAVLRVFFAGRARDRTWAGRYLADEDFVMMHRPDCSSGPFRDGWAFSYYCTGLNKAVFQMFETGPDWTGKGTYR